MTQIEHKIALAVSALSASERKVYIEKSLKIAPFKVAFLLASRCFEDIASFSRISPREQEEETEAIKARIDDLAAYCALLKATLPKQTP